MGLWLIVLFDFFDFMFFDFLIKSTEFCLFGAFYFLFALIFCGGSIKDLFLFGVFF